jgi:hypothetical protein
MKSELQRRGANMQSIKSDALKPPSSAWDVVKRAGGTGVYYGIDSSQYESSCAGAATYCSSFIGFTEGK